MLARPPKAPQPIRYLHPHRGIVHAPPPWMPWNDRIGARPVSESTVTTRITARNAGMMISRPKMQGTLTFDDHPPRRHYGDARALELPVDLGWLSHITVMLVVAFIVAAGAITLNATGGIQTPEYGHYSTGGRF